MKIKEALDETHRPSGPFSQGHLLLGSGLLVASKYPFLDVHFYRFKVKSDKLMMKMCDYGCIMAKLDLGKDRVT